jgi:hypothetical protein
MRILAALLITLLIHDGRAADWNPQVLWAVRSMPTGGGYSTTSAAGQKLQAAASAESGRLRLRPALAQPSYCSGATYLVLLKVLERGQTAGMFQIDATLLAPAGQRDGQGVWGRWNANGPGTARLFHELGAGRNFTEWSEARPGDFMKIFWRDAVGAKEFGHLVVFLGTGNDGGVETVRFWSSNKPGGFGEKTVPKSKIKRVLFSRLERPERFAFAGNLPKVDSYLAGLLERESSFAEACRLSGVR